MKTYVEIVCDLLRQAEDAGIRQAFCCYTDDFGGCCATAAIYKVATGHLPEEWEGIDLSKRYTLVTNALQEATGVDFTAEVGETERSFFFWLLDLNDRLHLSFSEMAERLEREKLND